MNDDEGFETIYMTNTSVITITEEAYEMVQENAALEERQAILNWLRGDRHVMTHTARALANQIEAGEHLK